MRLQEQIAHTLECSPGEARLAILLTAMEIKRYGASLMGGEDRTDDYALGHTNGYNDCVQQLYDGLLAEAGVR